jgi:hypothetical protein
MTKVELIDKIRKLLETGNDLHFLGGLKKEELKTLIASIWYRVDNLQRID